MADITRRTFLRQAGSASLFLLASGSLSVLPFRRQGGGGPDFHMLVVGDSLIAGQGLKEEDKFYYLTRKWLEEEHFGDGRRVLMKNRSHSGSNIYLNQREKKALEEAERPVDEFYHQEVNFSFPSIKEQIRIAADEYEREGVDKGDVRLLMVSGGITNIGVKSIIEPFRDDDELREDIVKYCRGQMREFLIEANRMFPTAVLSVIGYYPMISPKSSTGMIYNAVLELYKLPGPLKPVLNNILMKQPFKLVHNRMTKRSRIWAEYSNRELAGAVNDVNEALGKKSAVFVRSPIDENTCFGTKDSLLWKMGRKGRSEDHLYDLRMVECSNAIDSMSDVKLDFKKRFCELSGLGHPNVKGSRAYAEAIKVKLAPFFDSDRTSDQIPAESVTARRGQNYDKDDTWQHPLITRPS